MSLNRFIGYKDKTALIPSCLINMFILSVKLVHWGQRGLAHFYSKWPSEDLQFLVLWAHICSFVFSYENLELTYQSNESIEKRVFGLLGLRGRWTFDYQKSSLPFDLFYVEKSDLRSAYSPN